MSDNILDRLVEKSGVRSGSFNKPQIPTIKLDGSGNGETAGQIIKYDNGSVVLGSGITMQIIRIRKKLMQGGDTTKYFSEEYDSPTNDTVTLWMSTRASENDEWGKPTSVATGSPADIRATNPVKVVAVVYGIVNDELVKMIVKGASTAGDDGLYDYLSSFGRDEYVFQFQTDISTSKIQKNRAISYHRMHFKRGGKADADYAKIEKYLDIINGEKPVDTKPAQTAEQTLGLADDEDF